MDEKELEYEMKYATTMAESELYSDILASTTSVITESGNQVLVTEGVRETILKYIDKVSNGIQTAWDRLKKAVDEKQKDFLENTVRPQIEKIPDDLSYKIENFKQYDLNKFKEIKLAKYDYEVMKECSESQEKFMSTIYPNIPAVGDAENSSIKNAIDKALGGKVIESQDVNKEFLINQFNFLTKGYFEIKDSINEDIETVNDSNTDIANSANAVVSTGEMTQFYLETCMEVLNEDGEKEEEVKVSDNNGEQAPSDATPEEKKKFESRTAVKVVLMYFKTGTAILTGKMSALNKARKNAMIVINYYIKGRVKETGKEDNNKEVPTAPKKIK